ncbi:hypothetical protein SLW70_07115 [Flavobacterium sp. NG2]|uniref:hypothetical protein n=1 Tax=Flavobacterium sp. NG2 TaxID=3097547 RepID=UPI002A82BCA3|nr:hypothetical protein [Flavobacterium sp. NG2]WPR72883.1 hypothetical protein SLW70_07115 [Flavobacterium sp. NG2]
MGDDFLKIKTILISPDGSGNPFYFSLKIKRLKRTAGLDVIIKTERYAPKQ